MAIPLAFLGGKLVCGPPLPILAEDMRVPKHPLVAAAFSTDYPERKYLVRENHAPSNFGSVKSECRLLDKLPREIRDQIYEHLLFHKSGRIPPEVKKSDELLKIWTYVLLGECINAST